LISRKPVVPNNRSIKTLMGEFKAPRDFANQNRNSSRELASIRSWARRSQRQNGEGFGGGRVVGK
jgi:hypothetical protein